MKLKTWKVKMKNNITPRSPTCMEDSHVSKFMSRLSQ